MIKSSVYIKLTLATDIANLFIALDAEINIDWLPEVILIVHLFMRGVGLLGVCEAEQV